MATYLVLLVGCYSVPFVYAIIHRRMLRHLGYHWLNWSVIVSALPFIIWDYLAIARGHWSFNPHHVLPFTINGLPIEEYLFYLVIPQAVLLIWVALIRYHHWYEVISDLKKYHHFFEK